MDMLTTNATESLQVRVEPLPYMVFHSVAESAVLIFPILYALTGGLILQKLLGYNFSVAVRVGYIALLVSRSRPASSWWCISTTR